MIKKLISWNVNGVRAIQKKGFVDILTELSPDIMALQETKAMPEQLSEPLLNIDGYTSFWNSAEKKGYSGVCAYSKIKPINVINGIGVKKFDSEGRVITLEFEDFYLINAYFPNTQQELKRLDYKIEFNNTMLEYLNDLRGVKSTVLCGDLNVAHREIDLKNPKQNENNPGFSIQERQSMEHFLNSGYVDTFRMFNQEPDNYTWWSYRLRARERNIGWRIDYFCVNQEAKNRVKEASILKDIMGSDHCPVNLMFE